MGLGSGKWWQRVLAAFLIGPLLCMNVSCTAYSLRQSETLRPLPVEKSKVVVLHQGNRFVRLQSFELDEEELKGLPVGQLQSDGEPVKGTFDDQVAQEVHLYLDETPPLVVEPGNPVVVPLSSVNKVMVYDVSKAGTASAWTVWGFWLAFVTYFVVLGVIGIIAIYSMGGF
jgi:hypothetical protein